MKRLLSRIILWFFGRGICACAGADSRVAAEVREWPDGIRVALLGGLNGPAMHLEKQGGRLRCPGARATAPPDLLIQFKQLNAALPVLLGSQSVAQAYAERRLTVKGDLAFAMSVVRVMLLTEACLFPRLITRRIMQRVPEREVSMARIYLSTVLGAHSR